MSLRVTELHRWPVKSMGGEPVDSLRVDGRGAAGDRTHALLSPYGEELRRLTIRQAARMVLWRAHYDGDESFDPDAPPVPTVVAPDGTSRRWDDPALPAALADDLGREVVLHRDLAGQQDLGETLLVTAQGSVDALAEELGRPMDLRRFRTNVHLEGVPAWAEHGWEGRRLRVGEVELELLHPCVRCVIPTRDPDTAVKHADVLRHLHAAHDTSFGINARVVVPGTIRRGDVGELT